MAYQQRRKLFVKERFLEGNRQKWCIIFLVAGSIILGMDAYHLLKDPTPYLTFLTFLAGAFILGYSGSETMKLFRAESTTENQNTNENSYSSNYERKDVNIKEERLTNNAKEEDYNISEVEA
jgi:hypothetical protein